jgi:hypothetical protein
MAACVSFGASVRGMTKTKMAHNVANFRTEVKTVAKGVLKRVTLAPEHNRQRREFMQEHYAGCRKCILGSNLTWLIRVGFTTHRNRSLLLSEV